MKCYPDGMTVAELHAELQHFLDCGCGGHTVSFHGMRIHKIYEDTENGLTAELGSEQYGPFLDEIRKRSREAVSG